MTHHYALSVKLDDEMRERLSQLAHARQQTPAGVAQEAVRQYVEREEKREAFKQAAQTAWDEYQASGLHVTGEEMDEWLDKLAKGEDAEPPACHA